MTRKILIAVALCVVLLTTVGVSVVAAAQLKLPPPYRVVQFDVTYNHQVVGKLSVNTNQWTYVLTAHGLQPGRQYYFYSRGKFPYIGTEMANENGDLHIQDAWDPQKVDVVGRTPEFILYDEMLEGGWCVETQLTAKCYVGVLRSTCWGTLKSSGGTPIPYQPLEVDWYKKSTDIWYYWFSTTTDGNGVYKKTHDGSPSWAPMVIYEGGTYNGTPYCSTWAYASLSPSIPL